jgi:DNA-binding transcriptional ArsR family regulator
MVKTSEAKLKILNLIWTSNMPLDVKQISEMLGMKPRALNMHLLRLLRDGLVAKDKVGRYTLTPSGKKIIGIPKVDKELAGRILRKTSLEKAFHFYRGIGQPLGVSSDSLLDFSEKLGEVQIESVKFHSSRGDFASWVASLGDFELAKRLEIIRQKGLRGEELRSELCRVVKDRCEELLANI